MLKGICKECLKEFVNLNKGVKYQYFCCLACKNSFREKHQDKYSTTKKLRSRSPEAYIRQLAKRKVVRKLLKPEDYIDLYHKQKGLCAISKVPMTYTLGEGIVPTNISVDRINPRRGYELGNIQLVCRQVNMMKYVETEEQLYWWCEQVLKNRRGHNPV